MRATILNQLKEKADQRHQSFVEKLTPDVAGILGVPMPELRKMARGILKEDSRAFLMMCETEWEFSETLYMEEKILWGLVLGHEKMGFDERMERLGPFVEAIDSWPVCDLCKTDFHFLKTKEERVNFWPVLMEYGRSRKTYFLRFFLVCAMGYYRTPPYLQEIYGVVTQQEVPGYYGKMAAAWMLQQCYLVDPQEVERIFREREIKDPFVHNKGIQKIIESRTVSPVEKEKWKILKAASLPESRLKSEFDLDGPR
jgi:3-methyladenine DNA glycosylase AlkD